MKILINTATTNKGGGVQVALSLIEELKAISQHRYVVILGERLAKELDQSDYPDNFTFYEIHYRPATRVFSLKKPGEFFEKVVTKEKPDVMLTTSGPAYWRPPVPHIVGYNLPHYIYPESPFFRLIGVQSRFKWRLKGILIKYFYRKEADYIIGQNRDVTERALKWLGLKNGTTITNNCSSYYTHNPAQVENKLPVREENEFRFLTLSGYYRHKNLEILNRVIPELKKRGKHQVRFVLTLPDHEFNSLFSKEAETQIYNIGPVPVKEGFSLYNECDAMFLPTLLECFSASYPEAMATKKSIVTTDMSFARSICGEAALYFDAVDAASAVDKIERLISNRALQNTLVEAGLDQLKKFDTPKQRAEKYLELCERLIR